MGSARRKIVLVTFHYAGSTIRTGFHWLADAYARTGWDVLVFTTTISWLSRLRGDFRLAFRQVLPSRRIARVREGVRGYVWFTPWHPMNLRVGFLNLLEEPFCRLYSRLPIGKDVEAWFKGASMILFDSTPGLLLFDRIQALNPRARYVYRMSDDLRVNKVHPSVLRAEERILSKFSLISVPSANMAHLGRGLPALKIHRHGLEKELFEQDYPNPYEGPGPQVLWIGNRSFDHDFLRRAARLFPSWRFHLAGLVDPGESPPNIEHHGVLSVAQTLPLLKHASIGLACYRPHPGGEFLTDSLKIIQYTYCRLPIVAPDFVAPAANHFCHYKPGDDASIRSALERAATYDRNAISRDSIRSWDDLALVLAGEKG